MEILVWQLWPKPRAVLGSRLCLQRLRGFCALYLSEAAPHCLCHRSERLGPSARPTISVAAHDTARQVDRWPSRSSVRRASAQLTGRLPSRNDRPRRCAWSSPSGGVFPAVRRPVCANHRLPTDQRLPSCRTGALRARLHLSVRPRHMDLVPVTGCSVHAYSTWPPPGTCSANTGDGSANRVQTV